MSHHSHVTAHATYVTADAVQVVADAGPVAAEATYLDRMVDDAGMDSFPASDPPSCWSGIEPARGGET
jgi:hypothetical protein